MWRGRLSGHLPRCVTAIDASTAGQRSVEHAYELIVPITNKEEDLRKRQIAVAQEELFANYDVRPAPQLSAVFKRNRTAVGPTAVTRGDACGGCPR